MVEIQRHCYLQLTFFETQEDETPHVYSPVYFEVSDALKVEADKLNPYDPNYDKSTPQFTVSVQARKKNQVFLPAVWS